uniref:Uncharacterized protein n=1 Tax=Anguilla anguilla TaxID=7936 RepID=A0A0E9W684_ANGAN
MLGHSTREPSLLPLPASTYYLSYLCWQTHSSLPMSLF